MAAADPVLRSQIDGVAIHPYAATPSAVLARVVQARQTLATLGLATVPLYVTEFGWTTSPQGALDWLPARLRPGYVESTLASLAASGCGVAAALLYTWFSPARNPSDAQQWFGISGSSTDVDAFAAGLREATRARPQPSSACAA
jgi:hypothetical protein